jgi:hypothetical protein
VQQGDDGPGLFVELHDADRDRLQADLHATLNAMRAYRDTTFGPLMVPASRCSEPGAVTAIRRLWQMHVRRALAALADARG